MTHAALADLEEAAQHYVAAMDALAEMKDALDRARVLIEQAPAKARRSAARSRVQLDQAACPATSIPSRTSS